jgi:hypothetical protein
MLLFKFMSHQYDFAFRFVSSCVSDTDLSPEEAQVRRVQPSTPPRSAA